VINKDIGGEAKFNWRFRPNSFSADEIDIMSDTNCSMSVPSGIDKGLKEVFSCH